MTVQTNSKLDRLIQLKKEYEELVSSMGQEIFAEAFSELPDEIVALGWKQWIPGFNDGEPCTFSVGEVFFIDKTLAEFYQANTADELRHLLTEDDGISGSPQYTWSNGNRVMADPFAMRWYGPYGISDDVYSKPEPLFAEENPYPCWKTFFQFMRMEDLLESTFGSHAFVTAIRMTDGSWNITREDYDCGY